MLDAPAVGTTIDSGARIGVDRYEFDIGLLQTFSAEIFGNPGNARAVVVERQRPKTQVEAGRSIVCFEFCLPERRTTTKRYQRPRADMPLDFEVGVVLPGEERESEQTPRFQGVGFGCSEDFSAG